MFAYGIDFYQTANRNLLTHLAQGLDFRTSGGNGNMIFSVVLSAITRQRIAPNNLQLKGETIAAFAYLQIDLDDYATAEAMFRERR